MIVKNESKVIKRCLDSVKPFIDSWSIVDTGSTDDTKEIIQRELDGIPGQLHQRPWVNFGHNRTESIRLARDVSDYLLLLDADMVAVGTPDKDLKADSYLVRYTGNLRYSQELLVKSSLDWRYIGSTHEYITSTQCKSKSHLSGMQINHLCDGGSRSDKLQRDIRLLTEELEKSPNRRAMFYLAQTYRDLGDTDQAIYWFNKRSEAGGWEEEVWYAKYQVALLSDFDADTFLSLYDERPTRVEPLYYLIHHYRLSKQFNAGLALADAALKISIPEDILFVHRDIYDWRLKDEIALCAYYVGDKNRARTLWESLENVPNSERQRIQDNLNWTDQYRLVHLQNPEYGSGGTLYRDLILRIVRSHNVNSLLDFGCGKGKLIDTLPVEAEGYDPAIEKYKHLPQKSFDMVTCTDVLEHIDVGQLDGVLKQILSFDPEVCFFVISNRLAHQILPDGTNAHKIVESPEWWESKLQFVGYDTCLIDIDPTMLNCTFVLTKHRNVIDLVGKDVCAVVGNGPNDTDLSREINESFVIRLNNYQLGFQNIGNRTDLNISSLYDDALIEDFSVVPILGIIPTDWSKVHSEKHYIPNANKLRRQGHRVITYDRTDAFASHFKQLSEILDAFPTTGMAAHWFAKYCGCKRIILTGFTFFTTEQSYYARPSRIIPGNHHNTNAELELTRQLVESGEVDYSLDNLTRSTLFSV